MKESASAPRKKVRLEQYDNSWYKPGSAFKIAIWTVTNFLFFNNGIVAGSSYKRFLLRAFGAKVGRGVVIKPSVNIKYPWFLRIADYAWIGENVWIDNLGCVDIGESACISQGALLLTGNHDYKKQGFNLIVRPIVIEDGAWIGAKAVVCPGVSCRSHSVLTVGSVATSDLDAYCIYQGSPAVKVKERVLE